VSYNKKMGRKVYPKTKASLPGAGIRILDTLIPIVGSYLAYRYDGFGLVSKFGLSAYLLYYVIFLLAVIIAAYVYKLISQRLRRRTIKNM
jgi:uncharacterized membrane protein